MRQNAKLEVGQLVVFNHSQEAALFRVKAVLDKNGYHHVEVVDRALEDMPNIATQWVDKSSILLPSIGQLRALA